MNIDAYNLIIDTIKPLLDNRKFKTIDTDTGSYFTGENMAIRVTFDEDKSLFCLEQAGFDGEEVAGAAGCSKVPQNRRKQNPSLMILKIRCGKRLVSSLPYRKKADFKCRIKAIRATCPA